MVPASRVWTWHLCYFPGLQESFRYSVPHVPVIVNLEEWSDDNFLLLNRLTLIYMQVNDPFQEEVSCIQLCITLLVWIRVRGGETLQISRCTLNQQSLLVGSYLRTLLQSQENLYRQFYNNAKPATLKQLYISLVRPHLEYAAQVWDPYLQGDIDKLEAVQRFTFKLISWRWDLGYEEMSSIADVPRLAMHDRLHLKLAQVFKIVYDLCYFPESIFMVQPPHLSRLLRSDTLLCACPFGRTNYYFYSLYLVLSEHELPWRGSGCCW